MRIVIVDDEYLAIKVIEQYAAQIQTLSVAKTYVDPQEALAYLTNQKVDLLFLDIQMPELTGFEILKKLTDPPLVIVTTARHEFAVDAFELEVVDYLTKPISFERFEKAVTRASEYRQYRRSKENPKNFIMIRADYRVVKIFHHEIIYFEGLGEYIKVHTHDATYITYGAMKDLLLQLPENNFIRIHKSFVIALDKIQSFNTRVVQLINGKALPVGRVYRENFGEKMRS
jgi:two-component system response regulator LytT